MARRLFGSSGIRGPYPASVDAALALQLGGATGALAGRLIVGHDPRLTSPLLSEAFTAGALAAGAAVDAAGPAATPSLAYAARDYDAAVAVTASHNPPTDNGFKFWNPDGSAWSPEQEAALEAGLSTRADPPPWNRMGRRGARRDVAERHRDAILRFTGSAEGRVVLDCGHGAGAYVSPALLQAAGLDVTVLGGEPDGRFPGRPSEPTPEALGDLLRRCAAEGAWGIAHDGDADRMVAVDARGDPVPPERVLVALALLRGARRIATPVDASLALAAALPQVVWEFTPVGDAAVSAALRARGGDLGAETSGTYIVPAFDYAPDGPLAALLFLQAVERGLVDEAARRLRPVHRRSEKLPLGPVPREAFRERVAAYVPPGAERTSRVDGLRVDADDGWFLVRPSGTEPVVRVTAEARDADDAQRLLHRGRDVARRLLGGT